MEEELKKKKPKAALIIIAVTLVIVIAIAAVIIVKTGNPEYRLKKHLDLADRYLSELKYEQAIAEYELALEIDPMSVDGYLGLSEAYIGLGKYDEALDALRNGLDKTGDERIRQRIEELTDQTVDFSNAEKISMGHYDGIALNWYVLENTGDTKLLILDSVIPGYGISDNISWDEYACWKDSNLRKWLNGDFYMSSFSDEEREQILRSEITTEEITNSYPATISWANSAMTEDYIYCLSVREYESYFRIDNRGYNGEYVFSMDGICAGVDGSGDKVVSDFVTQEVYDDRCVGMIGLPWYLRETSPNGTEGLTSEYMGCVWVIDIHGATHPYIMDYTYNVRPVMRISTEVL